MISNIINWIVDSIKTFWNTPYANLNPEQKSSFWAAITVIGVALFSLFLLGWFIKDFIDTMIEKRRQEIKNTELYDYVKLNNKPTLNGVLLNNKKKEDD